MRTGCGFLCLHTLPPRAPVPAALTRCRTPNWIRPTVSPQSQQQLNNTKTRRTYHPSVHQSHFSCKENRSWKIKKRGGGEGESLGRSRNGNIWMCLRTTREGKLVHFRINPDKLQICNYTGFRACLLQIHSGISGYVSLRFRV